MTEIKKELNIEELEKVSGGARERYFRHRVLEGDTIESVAAKFGTTVEVIMSLNYLSTPEEFRVGLVLRIPMPKC